MHDERQAAWELHVELATRVAVVALPDGGGLPAEARNSLDELVERARTILVDHAPHSGCRVESIIRRMQDVVLPLLVEYQPDGFRSALAGAQPKLSALADELAELADAVSLVRRGDK